MTQSSVTLMGTKGGPAIRPGTPMPTSSLLRLGEKVIVIDAGLGVTRGLCDAGVALTEIDAIFVTHLHSDHYLELGPLFHTAWTAGLKHPIPVYGPAGLDRYWQGFLASMDADIALRIADEGRPNLDALFAFHLLGTKGFRFGGIKVSAIRNEHPPLRDSFALRFDHQGKAVTFSGDTAPIEAMVDFAASSDLLIHEAMLSQGIEALCARVGNGDDRLRIHLERSHSSAHEVAKIAARANVKALALNHLIPSDDQDFDESHWNAEVRPFFDGPFHLGRDGMVIEF